MDESETQADEVARSLAVARTAREIARSVRGLPDVVKCPSCGSLECGPYRCRFSLVPHAEARK